MKVLAIIALVSFSAVADAKCLFGEDIGELDSGKRLTVKRDVFRTLKLSRSTENKEKAQLIAVDVSVITDKKTKRVFQMNTTFMHRDDGDNTWGWIEEVTTAFDDDSRTDDRSVVADIGDSSIDNCKVQE